MMAAELRMSRDTSAEEREAYVDGIIARLGLAKVGRAEGLAWGGLASRGGRWGGPGSGRPRELNSTSGAAAVGAVVKERGRRWAPEAGFLPCWPAPPRPPTRRWVMPRRGG